MEEVRNEYENVWSSHLIILFSHTFFSLILMAEILFMGWEQWVLPLIILQLALCWSLHLMQTFTPLRRLRFYVTLEVVIFFFYGVHATSFFDLSVVMVVLLMIYTMTGEMEIVYSGTVTYYLTLVYCLFFVPEDRFILDILYVTRLLLHIAVVAIATIVGRMMITRQRTTTQGFLDQINVLQERNERTEDFLTNVSHELRTPINAVTGISAVLLKSEPDVRRRNDLRAIQEAGRRLFDQIGDILDHTEISTGRLKISEDNYMISSVVNDLRAEIRTTYAKGSVAILFDISPELPSVLCGDGRKIRKILRHLIENAVKFTKEGAAYIQLSGIPKPYGINLVIKVSDTGIGIEEEEIVRLTERFYQSDSGRARNTGGLGLGLSVVQGLVNAMAGFLQIKSKKGQGTTVLVSLPQKVVDGSPCMALSTREERSVVFYDRPDTYPITRVWDFFNALVAHLAGSLHIAVQRATEQKEIDALTGRSTVTHLFLGWEEYEQDAAYFEQLTERLTVVVAAEEGLSLPPGSRVRLIRMPLNSFDIVAALEDDGQIEGAERTADRQMVCPGVKVLVVDDEIMNLVVAKGIFKDYQLTVETAGSGAEAIGLCEDHTYDLIFMDHMMPEMNGVEVMKRLRKQHPDQQVPIVALTANAVSGAREMFFEEGFDEFLAKPLEYAELERVLRKLLPASSIRYIEVERESTSEETALSFRREHTLETEDARLSRLGRTGIVIDKGLDYCVNDPDFYLLLLEEFVADAGVMAQELRTLEQFSEKEDVRVKLYAVRTSAELIGADELAILAKNGTVDEVAQGLVRLAEEIAEALSDTLGEEREASGEITREDLGEELTALAQFLKTYEAARALAVIERLLAYRNLDVTTENALHSMEKDVRHYEIKAAAGKLEELCEGLK